MARTHSSELNYSPEIVSIEKPPFYHLWANRVLPFNFFFFFSYNCLEVFFLFPPHISFYFYLCFYFSVLFDFYSRSNLSASNWKENLSMIVTVTTLSEKFECQVCFFFFKGWLQQFSKLLKFKRHLLSYNENNFPHQTGLGFRARLFSSNARSWLIQNFTAFKRFKLLLSYNSFHFRLA